MSHPVEKRRLVGLTRETCSIFDVRAVEGIRAGLAIDPQHIRRLRTQLCKHFAGPTAAMAKLPTKVRHAFSQQVCLRPLHFERRVDSKNDGATKLLFRTKDSFLIESVILRTQSGRTALCVSCQVGCAAACTFCATGYMGVSHNLTPDEMLDQIVQAGEIVKREGRRIRNIVFMGMGEPLHNETNLYTTLDALLSPEIFHHSPRYILVSTVGIPDAMIRFARRFPHTNLALSLHSARQEVRKRIVPLAKRHNVHQLCVALEQCNKIQERPILIEYLMLRNCNDSPEDADALIRFLDGLHVHVNLIPYNAIKAAPQIFGSERPVRDAFANRLKEAGIKTTIRYSLGADIAAACGQLVQDKNREIAQRR